MVTNSILKRHKACSMAQRSSTRGVARYVPWLQKALRIKQEAEVFYRKDATGEEPGGSKQPSTSSDGREKPHHRTVWDAVATGDTEAVRQFLEHSPERVFVRREGKEETSGGGATLLHEAAFHAASCVAELLLLHLETHFPSPGTLHAFVNATDTICNRTTALIAACRCLKGDVGARLLLVQALVRAGADVEHADAHGDNAIHWCARVSNTIALRWLLKSTDAAANAVFAENAKREKPLDIAKRQLEQEKAGGYLAQSVYNLLRNVDRKCNMRLKMQVVKRHMTASESERTAVIEAQRAQVLARADEAIENVERLWKVAMDHAEENRKDAEAAHSKAAAEKARLTAIEWLDSKDGKSYVKKQLPIATEELKLDVLRGAIPKPKDMRKAATQRASETYMRQQEDVARASALSEFRQTRTTYPREPEKLRAVLSRR